MRPRPEDRPLAENILCNPQVINTKTEIDKILQSATLMIPNTRPLRSGSFIPTMNLDFITETDRGMQVVTGPFGNPNVPHHKLAEWREVDELVSSPRWREEGEEEVTTPDSLGTSWLPALKHNSTSTEGQGLIMGTWDMVLGDGFYSSRTDRSSSSRNSFSITNETTGANKSHTGTSDQDLH